MQLSSLVSFSSPNAPAPSPAFDEAVTYLDWAHETAGTAVSDAASLDASTLLSASRDALAAAELLDGLSLPDGARYARDAANAFDSAATARLFEDPEVADGVIAARGEEAESAVHDAFTAIGLDGRGE